MDCQATWSFDMVAQYQSIRKGDHGSHKGGLSAVDKWEFGGEWPLTMRARLVSSRHFPDPLGIVTTEQLDKFEFV